MSIPSNPRTTLPSAGGSNIRTHVLLAEAPVTIASKRSAMRDDSSSAAADLRICRSTFSAASSCRVQCVASASNWSVGCGDGLPAIAAFSRRCVIRSGVPAIGSRRMHVVGHCQTEMPFVILRARQHVLATA
jgi:hypothetical protein